MIPRLAFAYLAIGISVALAANKTYKVDILENTRVERKEVKAGTYKIQLDDQTAVFVEGKNRIAVPAHTDQVQFKYSETQVEYLDNAIREIHVGGSRIKIVFGGEMQTSSASR
jgi:hypothetical protein